MECRNVLKCTEKRCFDGLKSPKTLVLSLEAESSNLSVSAREKLFFLNCILPFLSSATAELFASNPLLFKQ